MIPAPMSRRVPLSVLAVASAALLTACGTQNPNAGTSKPPPSLADQQAVIQNGARLFSDNCSGCHTLGVVGAEGGALKVHDRERVDGPNFDVRKEDVESVLYAIRNGGFSGAIMPENIVVGREANDIAAFLSKYAGRGENPATEPSSPGPQPGSQPPASQDTTGG
jgi:mono/diheme cytochrome c family protein